MNLLLLVFFSGLNTSFDGHKQNKKEGFFTSSDSSPPSPHLLQNVKSTFYIKKFIMCFQLL